MTSYTLRAKITLDDSLSRIAAPSPESGPEAQLDEILFTIDENLIEKPTRKRDKRRQLLEINFTQKESLQSTAVSLQNVESTADMSAGKEISIQEVLDKYDIHTLQLECPDYMHILATEHYR